MTKARDLANIISTGVPNSLITLDANEIPNISTDKLTSGTIPDARLPATALNSNVDLTTLSASNLTSGTIPNARYGTPTFNGSNLTNLPASGIENITTFRLTTSFTMGTGADITTNWSESFSLGTAISESSGIFSFPQTGIYRVEANFYMHQLQGDSDYLGMDIFSTVNGGASFFSALQNYSAIDSSANQHAFLYGANIFDVTNTSNCKIKLGYQSESATNIRLVGNNSMDRTYIRFIRLGAT